MRRIFRRLVFLQFACLILLNGAEGQSTKTDLTRQPTLYVVGYAHLDTQWRWEYPRTIMEFLPKTMRDNFLLFERYPHYIFNFSGANRYRMMKEYYPSDYEKVKQYVAAGRWFPAGSAMEESDVNVPSAESIIRQILYGSRYFRREFGKTSVEYMLPDCFGFPASLPSILAHMGIKGFSTQKLEWGSAAGIPFNVGLWEGPDGRSVLAALNPGSYGADVKEDLSRSEAWFRRVQQNGQKSGLFADYRYYGTGDTGGSPREESVRWVEQSVTGSGPLRVLSSTAEQMFLDIGPEQTARLPRYQGDLLLREHSAGSITSEAYMKQWNHKNELLADAAERASAAAEWLGVRSYPLERLNNAWTLVASGQFHDILPGTSTPKAYEYAWNDALLAMNQFAGVLGSATEGIASGLDTQTRGRALLVYNPLSIEREDVVEATLQFPGGVPKAVRVIGPDGTEAPAQLTGKDATTATILFLAKAPPVGYSVFDVQPAAASIRTAALRVTTSLLENRRYRLRIDGNGDIASLFDKSLQRELLSAPARLAFQREKPAQWPAWNMDWADQQRPPRAYVGGPAKIRITETGPARVALEVEREAEGSRFLQTIRLSAGEAGNRVEIGNAIDWRTSEAALKATFPLTAANPLATYNWEVGTIQRSNNDPNKYEVPSHQWFDLTDKGGAYGVTILTGNKYGSDKPDDRTLRLTLIYTPGISEGQAQEYRDQATQDWGRHEFVYGLAGHGGDWRQEQTDWQALRLDQPLIAFESPKHAGMLGKTFSFLRVSNQRVRVMAVKKAEESEEWIVRLVELDGKPAQDLRIAFAAPVASAREVNGQEFPISAASVTKGEVETVLGPYGLRSFAVRLVPPPAKVALPRSQPVPLAYERSVASSHAGGAGAGFDAAGKSLPAEALPAEIAYGGGIRFRLAPAAEGQLNALAARGQVVSLPDSEFDRVYVLAASDSDQKATFQVADKYVELEIQDWGGYIGQWDNRIWKRAGVATTPKAQAESPAATTGLEYAGLAPGFLKSSPVAWFSSHRHTAEGASEPYAYSYLFAYSLEAPAGARTLTLPNNSRIQILAITVAKEGGPVRPVHPLWDVPERAAAR